VTTSHVDSRKSVAHSAARQTASIHRTNVDTIKLLLTSLLTYSHGALGHVPPSTSNNFIFSLPWSKSDSQLSKYCVVCEISWCRCQQLTALSTNTALLTKLLVIEQSAAPGPEARRECPMT